MVRNAAPQSATVILELMPVAEPVDKSGLGVEQKELCASLCADMPILMMTALFNITDVPPRGVIGAGEWTSGLRPSGDGALL